MSSTGVNLTSMGLNSSTVSSGNGIDVTAVVDSIIEAARGPEKIWQSQQSTLTSQTSALNTLNSGLSALQTAMYALSDVTGVIASNNATSSQTGILTATAQAGAAAGSHQIVVSNLATTSSAYSDPETTAATTFQNGVVTLKVGSTSTDITVDSSNNTLNGLAKTINDKKLGVVASVISDSSGARLALVSSATGAPGDLTITGNTSGLAFHKSVTGQDASLTIDGVPVSSSTNTVTGAISGVTLNLVSASSSTPVQLTVGPDTAGTTQAVQNFVSAYNTLIGSINAQFTVNSTSKTAGPLAGDISLRMLQSNLLSDITYSMSGNNGINSLASLGIDMANDGTLSIDSTKLNSAVTNRFSDVQNFFQQAADGFGQHFTGDLTSLTSPTQGVLNVSLSQISSQQKVLSDTISNFETQLASRQTALITQYSQIDAMLRQYPLTLQSVEAQLGTLTTNSTTK